MTACRVPGCVALADLDDRAGACAVHRLPPPPPQCRACDDTGVCNHCDGDGIVDCDLDQDQGRRVDCDCGAEHECFLCHGTGDCVECDGPPDLSEGAIE